MDKRPQGNGSKGSGPGSEQRGLQILFKMLTLPEDQGMVLSKRPVWPDL